MHIVEVIPLTNLPAQVPQLLSYFFTRPLLRGTVVEVLINNRCVSAIVVSSAPMEEQKISLKKSGFQLKKISAIVNETPQVSSAQLKTALWLSKNYYAPLGLCLKPVLPSFFGKKNYETPACVNRPALDTGSAKSKPVKVDIVLSSAKNAKAILEPEVKKIMAQKQQILLVLPEISLIDYFYGWLAGYYETAIIHGKIPPKKLYQNWNNISSGKTEIIIGTRQALFATFKNLGLIIIEDPTNEGYKSDMTPKYNTPSLARNTASIYGCPILYSTRI